LCVTRQRSVAVGSALNQLRLRTPRATIVATCSICGRKGLSDQPTYTHVECLAKPKPCECGQPSMPHPHCTHCRGSGRLNNQLCPYCPPGPCIECCWSALHDRIIQTREP
jgi:hypothetical protein